MNNADLIVATLKRGGIARGFGVPSGNVLPLMEAMRAGGINFVLMAHEGSAGFAAEVTGRLTGLPGLGIATLGPGATNLATGVGSAFLDRSPMIAITCTLDSTLKGRRIQMQIDHHSLFSPVTKATLDLRHGRIGDTLAEAWRIALSEPVGPVHLDLPEDVALMEADEPVPDLPPPNPLPPPSTDDLSVIHKLLTEARRPIAVIGADARRMADVRDLTRLVERHGLPFAVTTMAKGLIPDGHPLALGCIERGCRQIQRRMLQSADLIVGIGYDTIEVEYEAWITGTPLAHVGIDAADIVSSVDLRQQAIGDLDAAIKWLADAEPERNDWHTAELDAHRRQFQTALRPTSKFLTPHQAIDAVRGALSEDGILAFDVGAHTHQIASQWDAPGPGRFLITNGWSSMGFGLPAAIAAKLAEPERPVVCLIGDGCFQMTCGELAVAHRLGVTLPVVVLDDSSLSLIAVKQMRRQLPAYGVALEDKAHAAPPHYFGVPAVGVQDPAALESALLQALATAGPTVIEATVDPSHYAHTVFD